MFFISVTRNECDSTYNCLEPRETWQYLKVYAHCYPREQRIYLRIRLFPEVSGNLILADKLTPLN